MHAWWRRRVRVDGSGGRQGGLKACRATGRRRVTSSRVWDEQDAFESQYLGFPFNSVFATTLSLSLKIHSVAAMSERPSKIILPPRLVNAFQVYV
jgi:hypothetical protein